MGENRIIKKDAMSEDKKSEFRRVLYKNVLFVAFCIMFSLTFVSIAIYLGWLVSSIGTGTFNIIKAGMHALFNLGLIFICTIISSAMDVLT